MVTLSLTVLRHPAYGSTDQRVVPGSEFTIGRGLECDWALPDPMRSLSRQHCRLVRLADAWQVHDLSTNGTFVNAAIDPIGRDLWQRLQDGDRLRLGDYEVEVRVVTQQMAPPAPRPELTPPTNPFGAAHSPAFGNARLPGLDDPVDEAMASRPPASHASFTDHGPASSDAFVPPPAQAGGAGVVPDDWFNALAGANSPPPVRTVPSSARPIPSDFNPLSPTPAPPSSPATAPLAAAAPPVVQAAPLPPAVASPAAASPLPVRSAGDGPDLGAALALLMQGGELPPEFAIRAAEDPKAALQTAGALLRASVSGVRALLIARGMVKREFRIEQTMLQTKQNNPLKFAASDDQALAALLDPRSSSLQAMQESINDLTSHQVAVLAATQSAARALLQQLDPAALEAEDTGGRKFLEAPEKRLWEAYKRRHAKLIEQFEDDFESAFGTAFARAYEQAVDKGRQ